MKILFTLLTIIVFSNCQIINYYRFNKAVQKEKIVQQTFLEDIPFREDKGFLIVKVLVNNKLEDFIFDTGASTILDENFAKTLKYKKNGHQLHLDAMNNKQILKKIQLKNLAIGSINFKDIIANISNLDKLKKDVCLDVVGILGRNVMNKAVWQIDYKRHVMTLTNSRDSLIQIANNQTFRFYSYKNGTPKIRLSIDSIFLGEAELDTGSNGGINLPKAHLPESLKSNNFIKLYGITNGLFSENLETAETTIIPHLKMGDSCEIKNALITYNSILPFALIGNRFLRDYIVTIDWQHQNISLANFREDSDYLRNNFGFLPKFKEGKIIIGSIIENSDAFKAGLRLNDSILQLNQLDLRKATQTDYCHLIENWFNNKYNQLEIIVLKNNKEVKYTLLKTNLIETGVNKS